MADSAVAITAGTGTNIDTRTAPDGNHRQVAVIGDESAATVAAVTTDGALKVTGVGARGDVASSTQPGIAMLGIRHDSDTVGIAADGDLCMIHTDEAGRVKVATQPGSIALVSMSVSAIQATANTPVANATAFAEVSRASNVTMYVTGTFAGMNCTFEGSLDSTNGTDGTWFGIQAVRTNANTIETTTGALSALPVYAWEMSVNAYKYVRVRCTARTSGTQAWIIQAGTYATEPIPAAQASATQAVSGTVTANSTAPVTPTASAVNSAATTNATVVKASAGTAYSVTASNVGAAAAFVKLYNKASAPTVGTDVPVITIPIPAASVVTIPLGSQGYRFATGIGLAITNLAADTDTTAVAAAQVKVITAYI